MKTHTVIKGAFLFLIKNDQILLSRRKSTTHFQGYYGVISGNVEKEETYQSAIIREAEEEIGIRIFQEDLKVAHVMHRIDQEDESIFVFFITGIWIGDIENRELNKCEELRWDLLNNLPESIVPYINDAIRLYKNNVYFSEYIWQ